MAQLSATTVFGKLKATGEAIVNSVLRVKNGIKVEGSEDHSYAGIRAGSNANNGNLMLDSNGGSLFLNWKDGGKIKLKSTTTFDGNDINGVASIDNNGSAISVDDNLDLQSSNEITNATAVSTGVEQINDGSTDPSTNGEIRRNGADIKAYSGGAVRNLSDIGGRGGGQRGKLDSNSPFTGSGQSSYTFSLADTYDKWEFDIKVTSTGNVVAPNLQIEGDSGSNYTFYGPDGGKTSTAPSFNLTSITGTDGDEVNGTIELSGRWGSIFTLEDGMAAGRTVFTNTAQSGFNDNVTSPLTQFTLSAGSSFDVRVVAYGRDI